MTQHIDKNIIKAREMKILERVLKLVYNQKIEIQAQDNDNANDETHLSHIELSKKGATIYLHIGKDHHKNYYKYISAMPIQKNYKKLLDIVLGDMDAIYNYLAVSDFAFDLYYNSLIDNIIEYSICKYLSNNDKVMSRTLYNTLKMYHKWSVKTYEGDKMPFGLIAKNVNFDDLSSPDYVHFLDSNFSAPFTNATNTWIVITKQGKLISYDNANSVFDLKSSNKKALCLYDLTQFAEQCTNNAIGIVLRPNGDILLIKGKGLQFAKMSGQWKFYSYELFNDLLFPLFGNMDSKSSKERRFVNSLLKEMYLSIIDLSLSRIGGLIAIAIDNKNYPLYKGIAHIDKEAAINEKNSFLLRIIDTKTFTEIDRDKRLELLSQDGAMIINEKGEILTCGEIITITDAGSTGGGRTKAAQTLAKLGIAFKISEDGGVHCYKWSEEKDKAVELLSF